MLKKLDRISSEPAKLNYVMKNKKAFEFNFAWIFAILVGIAILFLAIYAASKFVETRKYELDTQTAAQFSILIDPLETSLESGKSSKISFNAETKIYNDCDSFGQFGQQEIKIATSGEKAGGEKKMSNKYIFSGDMEEGKEFFVFTKPFNMPFKVSDLIFLYKDYCFVDAPDFIREEVEDLNLDIEIKNRAAECSENTKKVCFSQSSQCDVSVNDNAGYVEKQGKKMYYTGSLIYAAIFSSPEIYDCNLRRLMLRLDKLCLVYQDKIDFLETKGCNSPLYHELTALRTLANSVANNATAKQSLQALQDKADELEAVNNVVICKVF